MHRNNNSRSSEFVNLTFFEYLKKTQWYEYMAPFLKIKIGAYLDLHKMPIKVLTFQYNEPSLGSSNGNLFIITILFSADEVFVLPNKILMIYSTEEWFESTFSQIKELLKTNTYNFMKFIEYYALSLNMKSIPILLLI